VAPHQTDTAALRNVKWTAGGARVRRHLIERKTDGAIGSIISLPV